MDSRSLPIDYYEYLLEEGAEQEWVKEDRAAYVQSLADKLRYVVTTQNPELDYDQIHSTEFMTDDPDELVAVEIISSHAEDAAKNTLALRRLRYE